ncbi:MAG TPA: hypothetical protein VEZ70_13680 [Allosphingosinicella sp.]|nr:hypothetical protein [Allosphingosinicella sp.]
MIGRILTGWLGHRVGERYGNNGFKGALIGAGVSMVAKRGLGPLSLVIGGGYLAKKLIERRRARRERR